MVMSRYIMVIIHQILKVVELIFNTISTPSGKPLR